MRPSRLVPALLVAALTGAAAPAAFASPVSLPDGHGRPPAPPGRHASHGPTGRLQVRFKDGVDAKGREAAYGRARGKGHTVHVDRELRGLNAAVLSVDSPRAVHALLRAESAVDFVEPESVYVPFEADPATPELVEIGADRVHAGDPANAVAPNLGAGAEIAVVDSFVDAGNPDLDTPGKVTFAGTRNGEFTVPVKRPSGQDLPCDPVNCPHGTAVAAVAAAEGDTAMYGVAPAATIRSYNVFRRFRYACQDPDAPDSTTTCEEVQASSADIAAALSELKSYAPAHPNLVAVNMSLGSRFENLLVKKAIADLHEAAPRVAIVAAAGNDGSERASFPAGSPYTLSVGAIGQSQPQYDPETGEPLPCPDVAPGTPWTVTGFSNRGDVDVVAPGRCVTSYYTPSNDQGVVTGPFALTRLDGTSFAAPMVAGVAALLASGPSPVTGDAARAAIMAGALHTGSVESGLGRVRAPQAIDVADGPSTYIAMSVDRGGQVASSVGRRNLEVLRVAPGATGAPVAAAITIPPGYGTLGPRVNKAIGNVARTQATYYAPKENRAGQSFALRASGSTAPPDVVDVPMRLLDPADGFEGVPAASNEATSVPLTYGSRTGYVRSAAIPAGGRLDWSFTYDEHAPVGSADLWLWMPPDNGLTADAALEPLWRENSPDLSDTDYIVAGCPELGGGCKSGRYLVGWLLASPADNSSSTSRYKLTMTYANGPTATLNAPAVASTVTPTGPFTVSWGGARAARWDVYYAQKAKVGASWVVTQWVPWLVGTTRTSASFGTGNAPIAVRPGYTYHFQARAHDALGNPSLPVTRNTALPLDDFSYHFAWSAGWRATGATSRWQGTAHYTTTAAAGVTVTSETERFTVVGDRCNTCGAIRVYVDGVLKATVDTYSSALQVRQSLWTSPLLAGGPKTHSVKVVAVGTRGRPRVVLDGIATQR